jgi:hypothetical protein
MPLPNARVCNGSKRDGLPCTNPAVRGKTKCRQHGGLSLSGMASPTYKTGKYSKVIPLRLAQTYEEARSNASLLSLRDDVAACEARIVDLFSRVDSGESGAIWRSLGDTLATFNAAMRTNDLAAMRTHLATMRRLITQGSADYQAWADIQKLWKSRCKLTLTEQKTLATMQQMVTTEQLMVYFGSIAHAVQEAVTAHADPLVARQILGVLSTEFRRISTLEAN